MEIEFVFDIFDKSCYFTDILFVISSVNEEDFLE